MRTWIDVVTEPVPSSAGYSSTTGPAATAPSRSSAAKAALWANGRRAGPPGCTTATARPAGSQAVSIESRGPSATGAKTASDDRCDPGRPDAEGEQGRGTVEVLAIGVAQPVTGLEHGHTVEGERTTAARWHRRAHSEPEGPLADGAVPVRHDARHDPLVPVALCIHPREQCTDLVVALERSVEEVAVRRVRGEACEHPLDIAGVERGGEAVRHGG
jgi:hypothetical protein